MTTTSDLIGRRYPLKRGGYLEIDDGPDSLWLWRIEPDDASEGRPVRFLPPGWLLALTPEAMTTFMRDLGDRGIGWGMDGTDGATRGEKQARANAAWEREVEGR